MTMTNELHYFLIKDLISQEFGAVDALLVIDTNTRRWHVTAIVEGEGFKTLPAYLSRAAMELGYEVVQ